MMQLEQRVLISNRWTLLLAALFLPCLAPAATHSVNVAIDASKRGTPISRYIYGQFLEHGGDIVNTGAWVEMMVDRKFFYPVSTSTPTPPQVTDNAQGNPRFRRPPTRWWSPIGGDDVLTMDKSAPYTGDHTPLVKLEAKEPHGFGLSAADWSGQMFLHCLDIIDMFSEHYYASGTEHTDMKLQKKVPIDPPLSFVEWERAPAVQVRAKYEHYEEYLKRIPRLRNKPVPVAIDEWAYLGGAPNSYRVVPAYAWAFHEMFRHSDVFQLDAFTFATAMMSESRTEAILNPTGLLFKMYRDHFGTVPVEVSGDSPQPMPTFPAGGDQPAVNPGSPTYPLDVVAAFSDDRKTFTIAVLNPSHAETSTNLAISGTKLADHGTLWQMAPAQIDAVVALGKAPEVQVEEKPQRAVPNNITVPPFSVNIYSYPVQ